MGVKPGFTTFEPIPLREQLRVPTLNKEYIRECLRLPDQFLGACTLKEGTFVTLVVLQSVAVIFVTILAVLFNFYKHDMDEYWKAKFNADFNPHMENEEQELIKSLWTKWEPVTLALIGVHTAYFITGLGVAYALCRREAHPMWYLPWLFFTGFMILSNFGTATMMLIYLFIVARYRDISVTDDWVPLILVYVYAVFWSYGFVVSIAHYKRRRIVRYWKNAHRESQNGYNEHLDLVKKNNRSNNNLGWIQEELKVKDDLDKSDNDRSSNVGWLKTKGY